MMTMVSRALADRHTARENRFAGKNRQESCVGLKKKGKEKDETTTTTTMMELLRAGELSSRQALPGRGWVAPRRPGINKTTARPSPVLAPAWPLSAVNSRFARATPDAPTS